MRLARLVVPLLLAALAASASAQHFPPIAYRQRVLPNGLEVLSVQDRSTPTVAIHVWYRVGSKHDPEGRSGFAHLFEHIMFKSTKNMPSEMLDRLTEDVGGYNNAGTLPDATAYFEVVPSNYLETLLWAEAERMGSLNVDEPNFRSERDVVKEEYRYRVLAPPYGQLFNSLDLESFARHPYRRPGIGNIEELDAATIDDVRRFHATYYRPDNAILIVAGDFEAQQLDAWVDKYFAPIPKPEAAIPSLAVEEPARTAERRVSVHGSSVPLPAVALTWLTPPASHADTVPLVVAATILGEGESSRLQRKLVRGEIAQEVYVDEDAREDAGVFATIAILGSGHTPAEAEGVIRAELAALGEKGVTAAELETAKNLLITSALRERETNNGKAWVLGESLILQHDASFANAGLARIQAVTPADVQRVVRKYLLEGKALVIEYSEQAQKTTAAMGGGRPARSRRASRPSASEFSDEAERRRAGRPARAGETPAPLGGAR